MFVSGYRHLNVVCNHLAFPPRCCHHPMPRVLLLLPLTFHAEQTAGCLPTVLVTGAWCYLPFCEFYGVPTLFHLGGTGILYPGGRVGGEFHRLPPLFWALQRYLPPFGCSVNRCLVDLTFCNPPITFVGVMRFVTPTFTPPLRRSRFSFIAVRLPRLPAVVCLFTGCGTRFPLTFEFYRLDTVPLPAPLRAPTQYYFAL